MFFFQILKHFIKTEKSQYAVVLQPWQLNNCDQLYELQVLSFKNASFQTLKFKVGKNV